MRSKSLTITKKGSNPKRLPNIHPGEVLREEFLVPLRISAYKLAKGTNLSQTRISQIIHEKRGISAETALRLSRFFGNSPQFWLGLQMTMILKKFGIPLAKNWMKFRALCSRRQHRVSSTRSSAQWRLPNLLRMRFNKSLELSAQLM
jgi:antitoxin HigA-1